MNPTTNAVHVNILSQVLSKALAKIMGAGSVPSAESLKDVASNILADPVLGKGINNGTPSPQSNLYKTFLGMPRLTDTEQQALRGFRGEVKPEQLVLHCLAIGEIYKNEPDAVQSKALMKNKDFLRAEISYELLHLLNDPKTQALIKDLREDVEDLKVLFELPAEYCVKLHEIISKDELDNFKVFMDENLNSANVPGNQVPATVFMKTIDDVHAIYCQKQDQDQDEGHEFSGHSNPSNS